MLLEKKWPVDKIKIELRLEEVKTESGVLNKIHEALTVEGDLDERAICTIKIIAPKMPGRQDRNRTGRNRY
ncbi:MAG: hypothetical protein IPO69_23125 [Saprospiraceae bacterium]|nr:hypothetical protein [Saprospiraceae bacterium]